VYEKNPAVSSPIATPIAALLAAQGNTRRGRMVVMSKLFVLMARSVSTMMQRLPHVVAIQIDLHRTIRWLACMNPLRILMWINADPTFEA
jgi:hypothetical protein